MAAYPARRVEAGRHPAFSPVQRRAQVVICGKATAIVITPKNLPELCDGFMMAGPTAA
jgi:hypothetical protein